MRPSIGSMDRRSFLRSAGAAGVLGSVGAPPALVADGASVAEPQVFDFDEPYVRFGTDCTKWDGAVEDFGDGIEVGMGIADLDFRAAPCITRALAERCAHENWGYLRAPERYTDAVVDWNRRRYGLEVDPGAVTGTTGVHAGLIAALQTFAPPGSRVLMTTPVYNGFYSDLRFTRTIADDSPMTMEDGLYSVDFEDFERRARRASVFILCNPQNPTGNCWSPEDLTRLGELCLEHRVVVLADEIHCDFANRGRRHTPFASLPNREIVDNSLTFQSSSKSFGIPAMKVAWYFSTNPDLLERTRANTRSDFTTLGLATNHAALTEGESWLDQLVPYIDANHDFVERYLRENIPLVRYTKAQGTYLAWLDVGGLSDAIGAEETAARENAMSESEVTPEHVVQRWLAQNAGVVLVPGSEFGTGGARHMRMNLGTQRRNIERALERIAEAVTAL